MRIENSMDERILRARHGREYWLQLVEEHKIKAENCVILMPGCERSMNEPAFIYLKEFLDKRNFTSAIIVTFDEWVLKQSKNNLQFVRIVECSSEKINSILQFYCLYEFASNLVIASLKEPSGRLGLGIVGRKGITAHEAFAGIVYGLYQ